MVVEQITTVYMAKLSSGKTFTVVHKIHYSLENFRGASGRGHHVLYTASVTRGKVSQSAKKPRKFSHSKVLPYTVCCAHVLTLNPHVTRHTKLKLMPYVNR